MADPIGHEWDGIIESDSIMLIPKNHFYVNYPIDVIPKQEGEWKLKINVNIFDLKIY